MPLTTIDGKLYLDKTEFGMLVAVEEINAQEILHGWSTAIAASKAVEEIGYDDHGTQSTSGWPEKYLVKSVREAVTQRAHSSYHCELGEESVNGHLYGSPEEPEVEPWNEIPLADIGIVGPASLLGKIALELCRRLENELMGDKQAGRRNYTPRAEPPEEDQDDPAAEE